MDIEKLKYPIGKFNPGEIKLEMISGWIEDIRLLPSQLEEVIKGIDEKSLTYIYRPDGWNIRQLIHHLADSHMNSIIRFKLALTEDQPVIKPYLESRWAMMSDVKLVPIEASLQILRGVHARLSTLLSELKEVDLARLYTHPEHGKSLDLNFTIGLYAWHGKHHLEHIKSALILKKSSWN